MSRSLAHAAQTHPASTSQFGPTPSSTPLDTPSTAFTFCGRDLGLYEPRMSSTDELQPNSAALPTPVQFGTPHPAFGSLSTIRNTSSRPAPPGEAMVLSDPIRRSPAPNPTPTPRTPPANRPGAMSAAIISSRFRALIAEAATHSPAQLAPEKEAGLLLSQSSPPRRRHAVLDHQSECSKDQFMDTSYATQAKALSGPTSPLQPAPGRRQQERTEKRKCSHAGCAGGPQVKRKKDGDADVDGNWNADSGGGNFTKASTPQVMTPPGLSSSPNFSYTMENTHHCGNRAHDVINSRWGPSEGGSYHTNRQIMDIMSIDYILNYV